MADMKQPLSRVAQWTHGPESPRGPYPEEPPQCEYWRRLVFLWKVNAIDCPPPNYPGERSAPRQSFSLRVIE